jgi:hypothetical protein
LLARDFGKAVEKYITPLPPDTEHKSLQWLEDATIDTLSSWPGRIAEISAKLALGADPKEVDDQSLAIFKESASSPGAQSLLRLLTMAGVDPASPDARAAAASILQDVPLDNVPASLAAAIAGANKLSQDEAVFTAGRIGETGGIPGNVEGLAAQMREIVAAKQVPPKAS